MGYTTIEEIKAGNPMPDVARRYGLIPDRSGLVHCPFHGEDRKPSMRIFADGYKCFACQRHGDVIDFVAEMEHMTTKEAAKKLGGGDLRPTAAALEASRKAAEEEHYRKKLMKKMRQLTNDWKFYEFLRKKCKPGTAAYQMIAFTQTMIDNDLDSVWREVDRVEREKRDRQRKR